MPASARVNTFMAINGKILTYTMNLSRIFVIIFDKRGFDNKIKFHEKRELIK